MAEYEISTDRGRLDVDVVHAYLSDESYWAKGVARATVERSIANSLCFGAYAADGSLAGFARVVTDRATFGYLADVFVLAAHRGRGLGKQLVRAVHDHPDLLGLRRMMLATADAHELYRRFGYTAPQRPEIFMTRSAGPEPEPARD